MHLPAAMPSASFNMHLVSLVQLGHDHDSHDKENPQASCR